ncbi:MAG: acetyl xylan esterase [Verrucomicrobia subdivision 3 bacterium]|nr:acetyl xylan esterase [Limisphaerales bacterium]
MTGLVVGLLALAGAVSAENTYQYPEAGQVGHGKGKAHLFILSGQSNMERLDPAVSFTPAVIKAFGADSVIVVKDAKGSRPISSWYKQWKSVEGGAARNRGALYDRLMGSVKAAIAGREIRTVTFIWMQGERDAVTGQAAVYKASLDGLFAQLKQDLKRDDIHFVLGRLSDAGVNGKHHDNWQAMREIQVAYAEASPIGAWVNCDDLNDKLGRKNGKNSKGAVHYTKDGYQLLGKRFADKAIQLIKAR